MGQYVCVCTDRMREREGGWEGWVEEGRRKREEWGKDIKNITWIKKRENRENAHLRGKWSTWMNSGKGINLSFKSWFWQLDDRTEFLNNFF